MLIMLGMWHENMNKMKIMLKECSLEWSDLALFAILEKQQVSADQVYF